MKSRYEKNAKLNEAALEKINGGNKGDAEFLDWRKVPKYKVGDWVEVFVDGLHIRTKRCQILTAKSTDIIYMGRYYKAWSYTASDFDKVITADDIQR